MSSIATKGHTVIKDEQNRIALVIANTLSSVDIGEPIPEGTLGWDKNSSTFNVYTSGSWSAVLAQATSGAITGTVNGVAVVDKVVRNVRRRCTIAEINAGQELLAAVAGQKYRIVGVKMIAIGGNVGTVTAVLVRGTQSASVVSLFSMAQANLTRSTVLTAPGTGTTTLADGASFAVCDANTAIDVIKSGSDADTATHIDVILDYVIEAA